MITEPTTWANIHIKPGRLGCSMCADLVPLMRQWYKAATIAAMLDLSGHSAVRQHVLAHGIITRADYGRWVQETRNPIHARHTCMDCIDIQHLVNVGGLTLTQVAERLGFHDRPSLNRHMRNHLLGDVFITAEHAQSREVVA